MNQLTIGNLTAKIPVIQGGMGIGVSLSGLASAVANEGGIGVVSCVGIGLFEPDYTKKYKEANVRALRKEVEKTRSLTKGIFGVNIMGAMTNYDELVQTIIEDKVDILFTGAGLPLNLPSFLKSDSVTKLVPIVSSGRAAALLCKKWKETYDYLPDAIVLEGPLAGGHLGYKLDEINNPDFSLEKLLADVLSQVKVYEEKYNQKIPVIAAGGIYTGADIYKFLNLGASGVQMGTRFVTTHECDASFDFKNAYIQANKEDIDIIVSPVGLPGRAIQNDFLRKVKRGEKQPYNCPFHCLKTCNYKTSPYCILQALLNAVKGDLQNGFVFSGANSYRSQKIISVKELMDELISDYEIASKTAII